MDLVIGLEAYAYEEVTVGAAPVGLTTALIAPLNGAPAAAAVIVVDTASVRFRTEGGGPTAAVGALLNSGDSLVLWGGNNLRHFQAVRTGGVDASLRVHYIR